jgi:hypothetical protein
MYLSSLVNKASENAAQMSSLVNKAQVKGTGKGPPLVLTNGKGSKGKGKGQKELPMAKTAQHDCFTAICNDSKNILDQKCFDCASAKFIALAFEIYIRVCDSNKLSDVKWLERVLNFLSPEGNISKGLLPDTEGYLLCDIVEVSGQLVSTLSKHPTTVGPAPPEPTLRSTVERILQQCDHISKYDILATSKQFQRNDNIITGAIISEEKISRAKEHYFARSNPTCGKVCKQMRQGFWKLPFEEFSRVIKRVLNDAVNRCKKSAIVSARRGNAFVPKIKPTRAEVLTKKVFSLLEGPATTRVSTPLRVLIKKNLPSLAPLVKGLADQLFICANKCLSIHKNTLMCAAIRQIAQSTLANLSHIDTTPSEEDLGWYKDILTAYATKSKDVPITPDPLHIKDNTIVDSGVASIKLLDTAIHSETLFEPSSAVAALNLLNLLATCHEKFQSLPDLHFIFECK